MERPIIIGGIGGSGTRVLVDILQKAGCYFGGYLNNSKDAMSFVPLYENWIPRILEDSITEEDYAKLLNDIKQSISDHKKDNVSYFTPWGWKNPRSIYLLKYFHELYPEMKFIHVVRDGRDMAFSNNQNQVILYAQFILKQNELNQESFKRSMMFWNSINLSISNYCKNNFNDNYLCIRFEDLCIDSKNMITRLCNFCNASIEDLDELVKLVQMPKSMGRWKLERKEQIDVVYAIGQQGLKYYGYIDSEID